MSTSVTANGKTLDTKANKLVVGWAWLAKMREVLPTEECRYVERLLGI